MKRFVENPVERRSEDRRIVNKYYTVEFLVNDIRLEYRFKIWDISSHGISLLVDEDSDLLNYLKVGDVIYLRYHTDKSLKPVDYVKTSIRHISREAVEHINGCCVVGLSILQDRDKEDQPVTVNCPSCNTAYRIPRTRVPQRKRVATCRKCGGKIVIEPLK